MKSPRGVTLIMVAAVLSILAAMATGFYMLMLMQTKSAVRYADSVRADMVAKAGIQFGVGRLRAQTFKNTEDASNAWYQVDYLRGASKRISYPDSPLLHDNVDNDLDGEIDNADEALADPQSDGIDNDSNGVIDNPEEAQYTPLLGYSAALSSSAGNSSDRFSLNISDAAGKININAGENLAVMLDNLCRVIGPPLVAAKLDALQPRRWSVEADPADLMVPLYANALNVNDTAVNRDIYYAWTNGAGAVMTDGTGRPARGTDGTATYGDGYAIAGFRARKGAFQNPEDIKQALTYVERNGNSSADDPLEQLEIEVKFSAIRDHITTSSWVDTNTVCVGKFEWIQISSGQTYAIDRDKSWVIDDLVNDPLNKRGSLRGSYLSIMNGHGAGQLRRIRTNGIDWVEVEMGFAVTPGPVSSYMIVSNEEAMLMDVDGAPIALAYPDNPPAPGRVTFPRTNTDGTLVRNPKMDYSLRPLCIHRAPVNVNTATDKVLVALLLGINVQHGHPLALGTQTDVEQLRPNNPNTEWKKDDVHNVEPYVLTPRGLKRIPAASGKPILNRSWGNGVDQVVLPPAIYDVKYLNNHDNLGGSNFVTASSGPGLMTEAHELAYRIIMARQTDRLNPTYRYIDPITGAPTATAVGPKGPNPPRGPFRSYDDLYSKVIKPFDDARFANGTVAGVFHAAKISTMLMANFNSNTDILKFNPNIEWIDRWGRNFTAQEALMVYTNAQAWGATSTADVPASDVIDKDSVPLYTAVQDPGASGWWGGNVPPPTSGQKNAAGSYITGAYITRSFRYKSDELIDKTDLNRSTTEFSFDSNGVFEIVSTGQVAKAGQVLAERKFTALVKVYDVWRESTQQQFVQGTISKAFGNHGSSCSGQLTRDASGLVERKGLVTSPEPLLPLKARIYDEVSGLTASTKPVPNRELVSAIAAPGAPNTGSPDPLNAFGKPRKNPYDTGALPIDVPEVLANRVLPARWDGQITLATNTSSYDPSTGGDDDTFLASFDGDLDTATCKGNGREQAKWPYSAQSDGSGSYQYTSANAKRPGSAGAPGDPVSGSEIRCVQSVGLLGVLFDNLIASDPGIPLVDGITPFNTAAQMNQARWVYPFLGISTVLMPTKMFGAVGPERPSYWNNVTVRMGSLRTDGAYLSAPGVSGNTATLKYPFSPEGNARNKLNFEPNSPGGNSITMWAKSTWHQDDMRTHEFFNPGNVAVTNMCTAYFFQKTGQYKWCSQSEGGLGHCGNRRDINDLSAMMAFEDGSGWGSSLHGGYGSSGVPLKVNESPSFRVQPFRWSFVGYRAHYKTNVPVGDSPTNARYSTGPRGHVTAVSGTTDFQDPHAMVCEQHYVRPFIDTELFPEVEANWNDGINSNGLRLRWAYKGWQPWYEAGTCSVGMSRDDMGLSASLDPNPEGQNRRYGEGQDAKWAWAEPYGTVAKGNGAHSPKTFGMNNLNYGNPNYNAAYNGPSTGLRWHYRNMPEDGTYAVIDEFKISNKDRILVNTGTSPAGWAADRVSREMQTSRYYLPPNASGTPGAGGPPTFTSQTLLQSLKGIISVTVPQKVAVVRVSWNVFTPRFMCEYKTPGTFTRPVNGPPQGLHFTRYTTPMTIPFKGPFDYHRYNDDADTSAYSVNRPAPWEYPVGMAHAGRGVEVELIAVDAGANQAALDAAPKMDSKTFTDPSAVNALGTPDLPVTCLTSQLRYRVRFLAPVDPLVDPTGGVRADPARHYLLDTPVFDDISITYVMSPRTLAFREITE